MPLAVMTTRWSDGRWPDKGSLQFSGPSGSQYAAFSTGDSHRLSFQKSTSVAIWFRVASFSVPSQSIIGKGNQSWRLQRLDRTNRIAFEVSIPGDAKVGEDQAGSKLKRVRISPKKNVNDGQWHLAVMTFEKKGKNNGTIRLFLDGKLAGAQQIPKVNMTQDPIWIGANSAPWLRDKKQTKNFHGQIDEVAVFNRPMRLEEVQNMYRAGHP